jgi:NADH dehydrogenase
VVIVGAGFGGLEAAKALRRAAADVVVIDKQNHHCFQPLLYQVATAALSPADVAWPIRHILRDQANTTVLMEEVTAVDPANKVLRTNFGEVPYDYLVLATGAMHSYFGHDEWSVYAPGLKRIEDATRIRRSILIAFEQAEVRARPASKWPARSPKSPGKPWPLISAASIRARRALCSSKPGRASCQHSRRICRNMPATP